MSDSLHDLKKELEKLGHPDKALSSSRFFKTGKGQYGEGDKFLGITVPEQRKVAKKYRDLPLGVVGELLAGEYHEHRLTGLLILTYKFEKAGEAERKEIYDFYLHHKQYVNNWDLVDSSAHQIVGAYLIDKKRDILFDLARSENLWDRRIAMVGSYAFIRENDFADALKIAEILVHDQHDLIHKAVGWMLREIGKRDAEAERGFLRKYHETMPRTMYRYAVENGVKI